LSAIRPALNIGHAASNSYMYKTCAVKGRRTSAGKDSQFKKKGPTRRPSLGQIEDLLVATFLSTGYRCTRSGRLVFCNLVEHPAAGSIDIANPSRETLRLAGLLFDREKGAAWGLSF